MSLNEKISGFNALVKKTTVPVEKPLPISVQKSLKVAEKFELKLNKLAQAAGLTPQMRKMLESMLQNVNALSTKTPAAKDYVAPLMDAINSGNPNMDALKNTVQQVAALFSRELGKEHAPQIQQAQQLAAALQGQAPAPAAAAPQAAPAPAAAKPNAQLPTIPKDVQAKLSEMLSQDGHFIPFKTDGVLGPTTQKALEVYKEKYNSPGLAGENLYNAIRKSYNFRQMNEQANVGKAPATASKRDELISLANKLDKKYSE